MIFQNMKSLVEGNEFESLYNFFTIVKRDKKNHSILLSTCDHQDIDFIKINTTPMHIAK